jgi:FkbM family methyltransferase
MNEIIKKVLSPILKNDKIYIDPKFKKIKIDVGLSINAPNTEYWLRNENDLIVIGFEPSSMCFDNLTLLNEENRNKYTEYVFVSKERLNDSFFPIKCALSSGEPRYQKFYNTAKNKDDKSLLGCSSLYEPSHRLPIIETENVPVISLSNVFNLFPWEEISYIDQLKIDAQGSDFNILIGAEDYLNNIAYITIENSTYDFYKKEDDSYKFDSYLKKYNFEKTSDIEGNSTYLNKNHLDKVDKIKFFVENK